MSTATSPTEKKIAFGGVTPVLRVASVTASIDYYTGALGFHVDFKFPNESAPFFASISRGRCHLFLSDGDQGNPGSWVWIDGVNVEAVYDEFRASGAKIRNPPTNYEWALEMQVEDLDGNVLRIGSDRKKDEPIGDWLDMHGVRWRKLPNGSHERVI
ncbi:MAG: glyoxalase superfamily protein [Terracidiphilus sp.]